MISKADEAALEWYFGPGLALYERSTFGAILSKLARDSATSGPCKRCEGAGILGDGGFIVTNACEACSGSGRARNGRTLCLACKGLGSAEPRRADVERGGWCPSCGGTGATPTEESKRRRTPCGVCSAPYDGTGKRRRRLRQAGCAHCLGTGEEPVSARQMHKGGEGGGVQADETAITRFAAISRRVAALRAVSPILANALAAWYGDAGQLRGQEGESRSSLLYPLTSDGRDYLLALEDMHTESLSDLRERADERSAELYALAAQAWAEPLASKREREELRRLAESVERHGYLRLADGLKMVAA